METTASWYLSTYRGCYALKCVFYLVDTPFEMLQASRSIKGKYMRSLCSQNNYHKVESPCTLCFIMEMLFHTLCVSF